MNKQKCGRFISHISNRAKCTKEIPIETCVRNMCAGYKEPDISNRLPAYVEELKNKGYCNNHEYATIKEGLDSLKNFYQLQDPEGEADKPLMTKIRRWFCALEKAHKNVPLDEFESLFSSNQNTLFSLRILPLLKFSLRILPLLKKITDYVE